MEEMRFSQFDKYSRYLKGAALLIALLTYWRFRDLELPAVYSYVAQGDVVRSALFKSVFLTHSIVWDFFGLIDRFVTPHSADLLRASGLILVILSLYLLSKLEDYILGQKFWGFLTIFLAALSPFGVVSAVSGGPAAVSVALTLLFLMALYRNQYIYAGILAAVCSGANLPGLIMFLIAILDLLQNFHEKNKMLSRLLATTTGFIAVLALLYVYSSYAGNARLFSIPVGEQDMRWSVVGTLPLFIVNSLNIVGIGYLLAKRRYDVYRTHFHTLMLWITSCAMCIAQPTTLNLFVAFVVSTVIAAFFLQGFNSLWKFRLASAETFVFLFVVVSLFGDLYANNRFLSNKVLQDIYQEDEAVADVIRSVAGSDGTALLMSNFVPAELSVKLGRQVFAVDNELLAAGDLEITAPSTIYVAKRRSKQESPIAGCKSLLSTAYSESGNTFYVEVVQCGRKR